MTVTEPETKKRRQTISHALSTDEVRRYYAGSMLEKDFEAVVERISYNGSHKLATRDLVARLALTARHLNALHQLSLRLDPAQGVQAVAQTLADTAMDVFRSDRAMVIEVTQDQPAVLAEATLPEMTFPTEGDSGTPMLAKTVINSVVSTRRAVVSTDAAHDERFKKSESLVIMRVHSLMAAPLLEGDRCVGILQVDDSRPGLRFSDPDLRLLVAVASMGARAMQHARLLDEQKQIIQDLKHARARLERSDQLAIVGRTATALAHEIKNQLGPLSLLDMLRSRFPDDEEVHESVEMVVEAQRRILSLVQEMRGYAQGDKACVPDHRLPVDVGELVHSVVRFLQFDRECREVPMVVEIHADIIADVDSDRIKQVLVNLIRNGVQALSSTEKEQRRIRVRVGEIGRKKCTIDVIDNGPGIEPDTIGKIFEPFFTTKGMEGTGLGLDISRQIVEAHDGRLVCTSKVGKGTVMRIVLPYEP